MNCGGTGPAAELEVRPAQGATRVIEYQGALTEDDYVEVFHLVQKHMRSAGAAGDDPRLLFAMGLSLAALFGHIGASEPRPGALLWLALALPLFIWWWIARENPRKQWRRTPELRTEYRGRFTDEALETQLGAEARIPWQLFSTHTTSGSVSVLFFGHQFVPLASSFFDSPEKWESARALIRQKVSAVQPPDRRRRSVAVWFALFVVIFVALQFALMRQSQTPRPNNELQRTRPAQTVEPHR